MSVDRRRVAAADEIAAILADTNDLVSVDRRRVAAADRRGGNSMRP